MEVFPELETARLNLRKISLEDVPSLVKYANNKKIADNLLNIPHPYGEPDAVFRIGYVHQGFKNKARYVFAIILKASNELIGEVSLHIVKSGNIAQLAYWIGEPFWNKGLATEAAKVVVQFGMEKPDFDLIFAECHVENKASQRVLLKTGFNTNVINGSIVQYRLTKQEFEEHANAETNGE